MKRFLLILSFLLLLTGNVFGAACGSGPFYVSSAGNDTNNGTSAATPWAHHPWDANKSGNANCTLASDNTVYMKKGDIWFDCSITSAQSSIPGHQIMTSTLDGFGTGAKPICSGSADTSGYDSGWTDDGGNAWHRSVTTEPKLVAYDNVILIKDTGTSPAANKWFWAANVLYVNVGGDPASTTKWRVGKRNNPLYINTDYVTVKDIAFEAGNNEFVGMVYVNGRTGTILDGLNVSLGYAGITATITNGEIKNSVLSNFKSNAGVWGTALALVSMNTVAAHDNEISSAGTGILVSTAATALTTYRNKIHDIDNIALNVVYGFHLGAGVEDVISSAETIYNIGTANSTNAIGYFNQGNRNILTSRSKIYNSRYAGAAITNGDNNSLSDTEIYNCGYKTVDGSDWIYYGAGGQGAAVFVTGSSEHNSVSRINAHDNYQGIINGTTSGAGGNVYFYNRVVNNVVNGMGSVSDSPDAGAESNKYYHNTIYHGTSINNNPAYRGHALFLQNSVAGSGNATFGGNLIYIPHAGTDTHGIWIQEDVTYFIASLKMDYNLIYAAEVDTILAAHNATHYTTYADYRGASGIQTVSAKITGLDGIQANAESHSVFGDPLFVSATDFRLKAGSPAINAGVNVGLTTDFTGGKIAGKPDIGAYERRGTFF